MIARLAVALLVALLLAAPATAADKPTLAQLEHEVMCPTCHTLLELSQAPIADRMRAFIRRRIAAGDSDAQIKQRLVAQFGEGVLAAPPAQGFGLVAWLLPVGGSLAVGAVVLVMLRRWKRERDAEPAVAAGAAGAQLDPELARRLDRELARFES
ncbi:MAG TPA: cytochrome c-type biogenesis protein [Gaiellaceae bacterium]|nr:cytochrome c-type biogenesis protein [Gaiellaceae bacterium]